jgi:hypothetical protein
MGPPGCWRDAFAAIDWERPWLAPYREVGARVAGRVTVGGRSVAEALNAEPGLPRLSGERPLGFVPPDRSGGEAYEAFIARAASVPTRDNLHDFFNGLVWLVHPDLKRHLNERQAEEIARSGIQATRGAVRDALTLFDENAALVCDLPPPLCEALRQRDWQRLFVAQRGGWQGARVILFGHALLEKLLLPRKPVTAHAWLVPGPAADLRSHLADWLSPAALASKSHCPLPVLGVPGWWPANASPSFYGDPSVFRPLRR